MKVIVNGIALLLPLTGIGQYIRHLFTAMQKQKQAEIYFYYGLRCEKGLRLPSEGLAKSSQNFYALAKKWLPKPRSIKRLVEKSLFAWHTRSRGEDVLYHEPNFLPLPYAGPMVLTIYDLSCFDHPESHPAERLRLMNAILPKAIERADHILVISEATRAALTRWFDVKPERMSTTYLAADTRFHPRSIDTLSPILAGVGLQAQGYVLCVGTLEPRKNLGVLFAAYSKLPPALRQRYPLVIAGMSGWHTEDFMQSAQALLKRQELRLLGYVSDELVAHLYSGAAAVCYPSRYEGFGLPALEAMASGVPVITSNSTSLPEVVGPDGLMVEPDDVDGFCENLRRVLEDRQFAAELGMRGCLRAQSFSWERCASETLAVYAQVMRQRSKH